MGEGTGWGWERGAHGRWGGRWLRGERKKRGCLQVVAQAEAELNSRLQAELRSMRMCFETLPSATPTAASV